jgi:Domain of unknown function (DUF1707)
MEPARQRISDQERHQVAEVLREAAAEGRIDVEELDERLAATFAARSYAELVPVTADLPGAHLPAPLSEAWRRLRRTTARSRPCRPPAGRAGGGSAPITGRWL